MRLLELALHPYVTDDERRAVTGRPSPRSPAAPLASDLPLTTTAAPSARNASAMPRPIPRVPPVMTATRCRSLRFAGLRCVLLTGASTSVVPPPDIGYLLPFATCSPSARWKCWTPGSFRPKTKSSSVQGIETALHAEAGRVVLVHHDVVEPVAGVRRRLALLLVRRAVAQDQDLLGVSRCPTSCRGARARRRPGGASRRRSPCRGTARRSHRRRWPGPTSSSGRSTTSAIGRSANALRWCGPHLSKAAMLEKFVRKTVVRVQRREVVALEVAVDDDLPVGPVEGARRVVVAVGPAPSPRAGRSVPGPATSRGRSWRRGRARRRSARPAPHSAAACRLIFARSTSPKVSSP